MAEVSVYPIKDADDVFDQYPILDDCRSSLEEFAEAPADIPETIQQYMDHIRGATEGIFALTGANVTIENNTIRDMNNPSDPIGGLDLVTDPASSNVTNVRRLYVGQKYQRQGFGTAAMQKKIQDLKDLGNTEYLTSFLRYDNERCISFLIKNGFEPDENYSSDGSTGLIRYILALG
jgi:GNAT superfamily N-acetyltransferase